ncbi:sigma-70 family RNA polymerase sigma factor [Paenibacillus sp. GSMTC-2017]|uniref:RNA polymerase sigma factor n=1 Tax=Paenibacillus sp. GSMTC-2017 TaxID=2794350 RepID=UPI0018D5BAC8|nr:sigma-70 family RNA polymerase sigma factor [Paenibacillus sp. GSMTC-2017]MBH5319316.1 sigma-70 family RNA polymerase sigma factor [Paenibacillus sp. GSMTC-2017]
MEIHYAAYMESMDKTELYNLMTQYGDDVWKYAYAITRNREQAKDIAQEVFIKVFHNIKSFRGQSSMKTWLLSITRNMAINEMKSSYMRRVVLFEWVKSDNRAESAEMVFMGEQSAKDIWDIIMSLPTKLREVIILQLEHNLTMTEMAQLLDVSEGTVKSRLHRARKGVERRWKGAYE